jgi:hypothetical protein
MIGNRQITINTWKKREVNVNVNKTVQNDYILHATI